MSNTLTEIYPKIISMRCQKRSTHLNCDAECRRNGHRYEHSFTSPACLIGLPNKTTLLLPDGQQIELSDGSMLITDYEY